jgi:uncharacterized membrane protein
MDFPQRMIVFKPIGTDDRAMTMWLRPNRALSHKAMTRLAWGLAVVTVATGLIGAHQGNVFAPVFALIEAGAVAWALGIAWRAGNRCERITLDSRSLEVETLPGHRRVSFQSGWVRVRLSPGHGRRRLLLASHGRALEIGAFLGDEERMEFSRKLDRLLAQVMAPKVNHQTGDGL